MYITFYGQQWSWCVWVGVGTIEGMDGPSNCLGLTRRVSVIYMFAAQDAYTAQTEDPEV